MPSTLRLHVSRNLGGRAIVADLTDSNPNVYYELGIAHGLRRPVILLTQDINELPFDLRGYRVIPYSTHFAQIGEARVKLKETAVGAREGRVVFGNPVSDFLPGPAVEGPAPQPSVAAAATPASSDEEDEKGVLDHFVQLGEALGTLTSLLSTNTTETKGMNAEMQAAGELMNAASQSSAPDLARNQREVLSQLGDVLQKYAEGLEGRNAAYADTLGSLQESLEFILSHDQALTPDAEGKREEFRDTLRSNLNSFKDGIAATENLTEVIRTAPSMERRLNRAQRSAVRALRRYTDNMKLTMAIVSRALELGDDGSAAS